jgi:integrase
VSKRLSEASLKKAVADALAGKSYDVTDAGAPGLVLRVAPRGVTWGFRAKLGDKQLRLRMGGLDLFGLTVARDLASAAMLMVREERIPPTETWLTDQLVSRRLIAAAPPKPVPVARWAFSQARDAYLDEVKRTRREATWRDRKSMLSLKELAAIEDTPVAKISRRDLAGIVAGIHRSGRERHAEHLAECLRPMWVWLAKDAQQIRSGVLGPDMSLLRAPERSTREEETGQGTYVPPVEELGRLLAIANSGILDGVIRDAIILLVYTAQRRRTVAAARRADFAEEDGVLVWRIPPAHRKTARRLGSRKSHDLPLSGDVAEMVRRRLKANSESVWLFPQVRPRRVGDDVSHVNADSLSHALAYLPGIVASPHDVRRGLTTHGQDVLHIPQAELKVVLDHSEGHASDDVTDGSYSKARRLQQKQAILDAWAALLDKATSATDLGDLDALRGAMRAIRLEKEAATAARKASRQAA